MVKALLSRVAAWLATLIAATLIVFVTLEILPGDPALVLLGPDAQPDTLAALRSQLDLDQPAFTRYLAWLGGLVHGDFGTSYTYSVPVADLIVDRLPVTRSRCAYATSCSRSRQPAIRHPLGPCRSQAMSLVRSDED